MASSTTSETAAKSPKDDMGSAFRARMYAIATGVISTVPTCMLRFDVSICQCFSVFNSCERVTFRKFEAFEHVEVSEFYDFNILRFDLFCSP